jgi:uroporphyrinogen decarboxylase
MNKRDVVFSLLDPNAKPAYIPAGFFLHFDSNFHRGQAAVDKHLEYFRYTGMDFVKIQYEKGFPRLPQIQSPEDWANMPFYGLDFYEEPLRVVEGLVKAARAEAPVILTLYSPFMCANHTVGDALLTRHILESPDQVKKGMAIITASLMGFVKECIRLGLDGFYTSTQGGEAGRFKLDGASESDSYFLECIKPYDLALMSEINRKCPFNILHICDYQRPNGDLTRFLDYPGQVVNAGLDLVGRQLSTKEASTFFGRPFMGGLNRKGTILTGTPEEARQAALAVLRDAPVRFILGADCTVPSEVKWENLKAAIGAAHSYQREQ